MNIKWMLFASVAFLLFFTNTAIANSFVSGYPVPQKIIIHNGKTALPEIVTISFPRQLAPAVSDFQKLLSNCGKQLKRGNSNNAFLRLNLTTTDVPSHPQGYFLKIDKTGISISARTPAGLFNGLQTISATLRSNTNQSLDNCEINDWPSMNRRSVMISLHDLRKRDLRVVREELRSLAALKYNCIFIDFGENFPYSSPLYPDHNSRLSASELNELIAFAEDRFIEIQPALRVISGCRLLDSAHDIRSLLENPLNPEFSPYCLRNSKVQQMLKSAISEQCALLNARNFVFYIDRIGLNSGFHLCNECRKHQPEELFGGHLRFLESVCADAGAKAEFIFDNFDKSAKLPEILKNLSPTSRHTTINLNSSKGIGAANIEDRQLTGKICASYAAGIKEFTILPFNSTENGMIAPLRKASPWFYGGIVNAANALWNHNTASTPNSPVEMFFNAYLNRPIPSVDGKVIPVSLNGILNSELSRNENFPVYSSKKLEDLQKKLSSLPEKFHLATRAGGRYYAMLFPGTQSRANEQSFVEIPLKGSTAKQIALLLSCTKPTNQAAYSPYDNGKDICSYKQMAYATLNYTNGQKYTKKLYHMVNISNWNNRFGGYSQKLAASDVDNYGRIANWWSTSINNPHPTLPLESITLGTVSCDGMAPALLALSLIDANAPADMPAHPGCQDLKKLDTTPSFRKIPKITSINFENSRMAPATVEFLNVENVNSKISFVLDGSSPSGSKALKITLPPVKKKNPERAIVVRINIPGSIRGAIRSMGVACRIDHPEYLDSAFQVLENTIHGGSYKQKIYPSNKWRYIWSALGNDDRYSRVLLRDPHRSNMRRIIFCFREIPETINICLDDIANSRLNCHTLPEETKE